MSASPIGLLKTRRLWPLVLAQSCGALNDNLVKNAMVVLAIFQLGIGGAGLSAAAGALFIAPYILLSATAGKLADRFPKPRVVLACKLAEVLLMVASAAAFLTESVPALLAVLAGLGVQAALFGPVKYGLLPEHLAEEELVAGNGVIEATTFLSIVCGTVAGGALVLLAHGTAAVGIAGVALSLLGVFGAARIPASPAAEPSLRITPNLFAETWRVVRHAASVRAIWLSVLGLSWFWTMGATLMTEFPVVARDTLHSDGTVLTLLLSVFAIGVGVGSVQCARLLKGEVSATIGAVRRSWHFAVLLGFCQSRRIGGRPCQRRRCTVVVCRLANDRRSVPAGGVRWCIFRAALRHHPGRCGGLRAFAHDRREQHHECAVHGGRRRGSCHDGRCGPGRARRAVRRRHCQPCCRAVDRPHPAARGLPRIVPLVFFALPPCAGARPGELQAAGDRVVIVANHQSYLDACLIAAYLPDSPTFAIHTAQAAKWYFKPFLAAVETFPVDVQSPYSVKRMVEAVRDHGRKLMIFPEGRMTRTGALMKVYEGAALVADKSHAKVVPISIEGLQFSRLGRMRGRLHLRWFPRLRLNILPPVTLAPSQSEDLTPRQRREVIGRALQDVMVDAVFRSKETGKSLFSALLDAAPGAWRADADRRGHPARADQLSTGWWWVPPHSGARWSRQHRAKPHLALLMPNAVASLVAFMGLQAFGVRALHAERFGRCGRDAVRLPCRRRPHGDLQPQPSWRRHGSAGLVERMSEEVRFIWLEEVRETIGLREKLRAKVDAWRPRAAARRGHGPRCAGGRAVHQRVGRHTEGRRAEPPQPARQLRTTGVGDRLPWRRHRVQCHADVPRVRPDRRHHPAAGVRRADLPLPQSRCTIGSCRR